LNTSLKLINMKKYLLFLPLAILASIGFSQTTYTWTGNLGPALNFWSFNSNWNPSSDYPKTGDTVIINNAAVQIAGNQDVEQVTLTGTTVLTVNNGVVLEVSGVMDVGTGTTLDISAGSLLLSSDASGAGSFAPINGTITGSNLTVQSYLTSAAGWRLLGAQIPGQTVAEWDDDIYISGVGGADGDADTGTVFVSMYEYDENVAGSVDNGYVGSNVGDALTSGKGFMAWIQQGGDQVVSLSGAPNTGSVAINVPCSNGCGTDDGWHLIANPFTSSIAWASVINKKTVDDGPYVISTGGGYIGATVIAPGQGFWVRGKSLAANITIPQSAKTTSSPTQSYFKESNQSIRLQVSSNINSYWDEAYITVNDTTTLNYDADADNLKLVSPNPYEVPNVAVLTDDLIDLYNQNFPSLQAGETVDIPLRVNVGISGEYTIDLTGFESVFTNENVVLEDLSNGNLTYVDNNTISYTFNIDNTVEDPRFVLHITSTPLSVNESLKEDNNVKVYPNPATDNVTFIFKENTTQNSTILITNQLGAIVKNIPVNQGTNNINLNVNDLSQGLYNYQIVSENEIISNGKIVVQ
jgi:Secretion system C-terminal sorting domain